MRDLCLSFSLANKRKYFSPLAIKQVTVFGMAFMQSMVATQLGVQKISGITMYAVQEKKYYEPLPDIEVNDSIS